MGRPAYIPGGAGDPFGPTALNGAVTAISEADRLHPRLAPADAFDLEVRSAFALWPSGPDLDRLIAVCRGLRRCLPEARHLTDEHLRHLWRTRYEVNP